jgi:hypothetical protein
MHTMTQGNSVFPECLLLLPLFGVVVVIWMWKVSSSRTTLELWAGEMGYQLLQAERRHFRRGPFFWATYVGQEVFFIVVKNTNGEVLRGWARVGGFLVGQLSQKVSVRWAQ